MDRKINVSVTYQVFAECRLLFELSEQLNGAPWRSGIMPRNCFLDVGFDKTSDAQSFIEKCSKLGLNGCFTSNLDR